MVVEVLVVVVMYVGVGVRVEYMVVLKASKLLDIHFKVLMTKFYCSFDLICQSPFPLVLTLVSLSPSPNSEYFQYR